MDWPSAVAHGARDLELSAAQRRELLALGGVGVAPARALERLPLWLMGCAAALLGLGLLMAVAANWATWSRSVQFAVLQGAVLAGVIGAVAVPRGRMAWGVWVVLSTGGLFAFFGQTYQTGADPWQLFALWAALCLPLALGVRSDTVWSLWVLVAFTAISLWMTTQARQGSAAEGDGLATHVVAWGMSLAVVLGLNSRLGRQFGAGAWARSLAACGAVVLVTGAATVALFGRDPAAEVLLALAALGLVAWGSGRLATFDVFVLSAALLGLNVLLVGSLIRLLFSGGSSGDPIGQLLLTGMTAAGLLAASVAAVMRRQRAHDQHTEAAR